MNRFFVLFAVFTTILGTVLGQPPVEKPCRIDNVCYLLDQSDSVTTSQYDKEKDFVIKIARQVELKSASDPFNSAVAFSTDAEVIQDPTRDLNKFVNAVNGPRQFFEGTKFSTALSECQELLEDAEGSKAIVLITDGGFFGNEGQNAEAIAAEIKDEGTFIVTVGVGSLIDEAFLRRIASPDLFVGTSFDNLDEVIMQVVSDICVDIIETDCSKAFDECEFTFRGKTGLSTFSIAGRPDRSFTPRIVSKDASVRLGVLNSNNIVPEFIEDNGVFPITNFGSQRFTPTHFKPYTLMNGQGSGIGHQTFHGNQKQVAKDRCIRVYFTHFQEIRNNKLINRNDVPRSENKCVVFRTQ
ncbi:Collagen alpha-1(XXVIII) chain [Gracilariopsis chorda]|uniref:Collagen alpha-1(XXVIII) chain n=1 Tax=Gracilariopsis chorda TaxID=448386 RepID=A0A2V3IGK2_9FLOR|nr:Collagen alpha-1(XXVIII) chain [Gracilariopsis chorda]PXF41183.1 Collagen alpha-1(XXVIII) chain [Gracilariopsis chorda]|eukprot:PXF41182.1 Collagen alpha-1(XXVIII) chain [Gracilariopsis chorda]